MCERYSWLNVDGKTVFLTARDVFHTKRGCELREYTPSRNDWYGHGAIRWYYDLPYTVGTEHECTDFLTPKNFPVEIVDAIKAGEMWEFGITDDMTVMLLKRARAEYGKARAEYGKACTKARNEAYNKVWPEYGKACNEAWAEYRKACNKAFMTLFTDPNNRKKRGGNHG